MKEGLKDTLEGISNSDRSTADRVSKGVLGLTSIGLGAAFGLIGLGIKAVKKLSEDEETEE
jgi:hypothetical protein